MSEGISAIARTMPTRIVGTNQHRATNTRNSEKEISGTVLNVPSRYGRITSDTGPANILNPLIMNKGIGNNANKQHLSVTTSLRPGRRGRCPLPAAGRASPLSGLLASVRLSKSGNGRVLCPQMAASFLLADQVANEHLGRHLIMLRNRRGSLPPPWSNRSLTGLEGRSVSNSRRTLGHASSCCFPTLDSVRRSILSGLRDRSIQESPRVVCPGRENSAAVP
jgi:hypothetical protein